MLPGLEFTNGLFANNTSFGKAALFVLDLDLPWLRIVFNSAIISGNIGTQSNDFFVQNLRRLDFIRSSWKQRRGKNPLMEKAENVTAKFLSFDKYDFEINIEGSSFDCQMDLNRSMVFRYNENKTDGAEVPLFKFVVPFKESFYSDRDIASENQRIAAEPSEYTNALTCEVNRGKEAS